MFETFERNWQNEYARFSFVEPCDFEASDGLPDAPLNLLAIQETLTLHHHKH
jgi:hypothetical protein